MRFRLRVLAAAGAIGAVLLAVVPGSASADHHTPAGPVVLLGTAGVRWSDVDSATPALAQLRDQGASGWLAVRSLRPVTCPVDGWLAISAGRRAADPESAVKDRSKPSCRQPGLAPAPATGASSGTADSATGGTTDGATGGTTDGATGGTTDGATGGTTDGASGGPATVPQWSDYLSAAAQATFDAHPGLLGTTVNAAGVRTAAVGPGAAIALADAHGRVARAWPGRVSDASGLVASAALAEDVEAALATDPKLLVVDLGPIRDPARQVAGKPPLTGAYALSRQQQVQALDARLGLILARLPTNATVIVASIADSGTPSQLQLLAARGPAPNGEPYADALLGSRSTRQDGLAQTTDLQPTVLAALSVPVPLEAVGSTVLPVRTGMSTAERVQKLADIDEPTVVIAPIAPWITNSLMAVHLLFYAVAALVLRRSGSRQSDGEGASHSEDAADNAGPGRRRALRGLRRGAVILASLPAATFLANLLPWWRADHPYLALFGTVSAFMIAISALALLGPWRVLVLGPLTVVATLTAGVLTVDAVTGSHLMISSLLGVQVIVAGRFYGFSNQVFALFATGLLLTTVAVADPLMRRGYRWSAALAVAGLGIVATVIDGAPGLGSDFGGPPALIPAFAVLALLVAGIRVTWQRALLILGVTIVVLLGFGLLDWLREPEDRTHLGRFVQSVIDGDAWPVISRKGAQNWRILTHNPLSALLPFAAAFVFYVLGKPTAWGVRPLRAAYDRAPVLRHGLIAFVVLVLIAGLLNDSGTVVPAFGVMLLLPLLVAVCVRALELRDAE